MIYKKLVTEVAFYIRVAMETEVNLLFTSHVFVLFKNFTMQMNTHVKMETIFLFSTYFTISSFFKKYVNCVFKLKMS